MTPDREAAFELFWRETFTGCGDEYTNKAVRAMCHAAYAAGTTKLPERYELHAEPQRCLRFDHNDLPLTNGMCEMCAWIVSAMKA